MAMSYCYLPMFGDEPTDPPIGRPQRDRAKAKAARAARRKNRRR